MLPVLVSVVMVPLLIIDSRPLIVPELFSSAMVPVFDIAKLSDVIVPVLIIVVTTPLFRMSPLVPDRVPLLVMVVIVPPVAISIVAFGLPTPESVIPAPTVKLSRVHPVLCNKLIVMLVFTAYGFGDRHAASAGKWINPKVAMLSKQSQ